MVFVVASIVHPTGTRLVTRLFPVSGGRLLRMDKPQPRIPEFSDRHDVVKTICVWRNGTCYRIEVIQRFGKPDGQAYAALLWVEEEQAGRRVLVRDVSFPWVHHESAESALDHALESLALRLGYASTGETEV
jgi:hypothetical protein